MSGRGFNPWYYSRSDYSRDHGYHERENYPKTHHGGEAEETKKDCISIYSLLDLEEQKPIQEAFKQLPERKSIKTKQKLKYLQEFIAEIRKLGIKNKCFLVGSLVNGTSKPLSDVDLAIRIDKLEVKQALDLFELQKSFLEKQGIFIDILVENHNLHSNKRIIPLKDNYRGRLISKLKERFKKRLLKTSDVHMRYDEEG